jgi:Transglycosylase-like domain
MRTHTGAHFRRTTGAHFPRAKLVLTSISSLAFVAGLALPAGAATRTGTSPAAAAVPARAIAHVTPADVTVAAHLAHLTHTAHLAHLARLAALTQAADAVRAAAPAATAGDGDHDSDDPATAPPPARTGDHEPDGDSDDAGASAGRTAAAPARAVSGYSTGGAFQQCVIRRESGGQSQVMNASGHYGLYQFSAATWAAYGGNPASFGHASVAQQNQVFANAMATPGGASNWAPYNGC